MGTGQEAEPSGHRSPSFPHILGGLLGLGTLPLHTHTLACTHTHMHTLCRSLLNTQMLLVHLAQPASVQQERGTALGEARQVSR